MQTAEVGIEITPIIASSSLESRFAAQLDALLHRTCQIARALTGAEQAALKLWVGEELMQDSNTDKMIFTVAEQIEMLSSRVTLQPGDLIMTGTPAGVGMPRKRFLRSGETVKLWIEKVGEFEHRMA